MNVSDMEYMLRSREDRSGRHTGQKCCDVPTPTEATYPSSWEENHLQIIRTGPQTSKPYGPQYGLQSPRADSTPLNHIDEHKSTTLPALTHANHLVPDTDVEHLKKRLQASY
ncbi:hypothetical protein TSTA_109200 [Talaromyces stipitatus ATCC 10500]|uniref:Uncharacterized protein n=1 Tax=Talaromyces stipitatus (strain ATCC 10500 / CBS 375.48 / QM 6759 / NRRL 1006) TaxID=441959 RepID=B8MUX3_TALSN|nr:uncharacterized protein TSTA_109200 [Talaromyces stipitatus ATCC 10500]EED11741.1 hypothetical protein TSTA_109200 [Talaromyces stipitatus ATCC 10500]